MLETICTIPVNEIFEQVDGCPICRMRGGIETHLLEYIMGAAKMEPAIREETNRKGFCVEHYQKLNAMQGRLPLALLLDTHVKAIIDGPLRREQKARKRIMELDSLHESCFICENIERGLSHMLQTLLIQYQKDADFRKLFAAQKAFCLPHCGRLLKEASRKSLKGEYDRFMQTLLDVTRKGFEQVREQLLLFESMYDYRSDPADQKFEYCKTAVAEAIRLLTADRG